MNVSIGWWITYLNLSSEHTKDLTLNKFAVTAINNGIVILLKLGFTEQINGVPN